MRLPRPFLTLGAALLGLAIFGAPSPAAAAEACVNPAGGVTVFVPGSPVRQCTVPAGVTRITVEAWGAQGGDSLHHAANTDHGGAGGHAFRTNYAVTPGATLHVIGGQAGGTSSRGDVGNAGGGGSSGVYLYYPARSLNDVVVIAGAGGGAACDDGGWGGGSFNTGGNGGNAYGGHLCPDIVWPGDGGGGGIGGKSNDGGGGNGFGGSGGGSREGSYGGWGGPELKGSGEWGRRKSGRNETWGGGGGGGYGGGAGGYQAGGGGGGSYPVPVTISPNWGNGRVQMSVSSGLTAQIPIIRKGPPGLTKRRRARFAFGAASPSRFECSLAGRRVAPKLRSWKRCGASGPRRSGHVNYRGLLPGVKVFQIKRIEPDDAASVPERREWRVVR